MRAWPARVEGPISDAFTYADMTLFCEAIYEAPELVDRLLEVCGTFSQYIAEVFAENPSAPLMFMGEDRPQGHSLTTAVAGCPLLKTRPADASGPASNLRGPRGSGRLGNKGPPGHSAPPRNWG